MLSPCQFLLSHRHLLPTQEGLRPSTALEFRSPQSLRPSLKLRSVGKGEEGTERTPSGESHTPLSSPSPDKPPQSRPPRARAGLGAGPVQSPSHT